MSPMYCLYAFTAFKIMGVSKLTSFKEMTTLVDMQCRCSRISQETSEGVADEKVCHWPFYIGKSREEIMLFKVPGNNEGSATL